MPAELQLLGLAVVIGVVQLMWAAAAGVRQRGLRWAAGPRDETRTVSGVAARLDRAFRNFMETFPFFAAAVLAAAVGGRLGPLTLWGAGLYVAGRAAYPVLYAFGIALRPLAWGVSMTGLSLVVAALFL